MCTGRMVSVWFGCGMGGTDEGLRGTGWKGGTEEASGGSWWKGGGIGGMELGSSRW